MSDYISRQAAIDAIKRAIWDKYTAKDAIDAVCNVPSAQPELVRCKDCKYWWQENNLCTHNKTMDGMVCTLQCDSDFYCGYAERKKEEEEEEND